MNKIPNIITLPEKKLVGQYLEMSLQNNKTFALFSGFMPNKTAIKDALSQEVFEVMVYNQDYFKHFSPTNSFTKWGCLEVKDYSNIPNNMTPLDLPGGQYAVFNYKALTKGFGQLMGYIMSSWLPQSKYQLDSRPHFNILGKAYKPNSPDSEEMVYIPIKPKV